MNTHQVVSILLVSTICIIIDFLPLIKCDLLLVDADHGDSNRVIKDDLLLVDANHGDSNRVIRSRVNPGCSKELCDDVTIVYTTSDNSTTRNHHFWSSVPHESPSFFIVESSGHDEASIDWETLLSNQSSGSISIKELRNAIGLSVNRIFFWDDSGEGSFNETSDLIEVKDFKTILTNTSHELKFRNDSSRATFVFGEPGSNLTVKLLVDTYSKGGRSEQLPRLTFNDRSLNFEVVINGTSGVDYQKNRVGIEFTLVHSGKEFEPKSIASIDDEFSPGVFAEWNVQFKNGLNESNHLKWKAIGYNKPDRIIAHTVDAQLRVDRNETGLPSSKDRVMEESSSSKDRVMEESSSSKDRVMRESFPSSLDRVMRGFFDSVNVTHPMDISITKFNMTFQVGEEYYSKSNYTSFSMIMALGDYEKEQGLSFMVKTIIAIGFGIPVIAIIASALYLAVKWRRRAAYRNVVD